MKIAVTGAMGFIGRHVLAQLAKSPVEVIAITRQWPTDLEQFSHVKFVQLDLEDISSGTFSLIGNPDILIHLAWGGATKL